VPIWIGICNYYGGRYYDAEIGRFISADPFVLDPYDPQNLNRYSYVINNPQNYIDPDGYFHQVKKPKKPGFFKKFFGGILGAIVFLVTGDPFLGLLTANTVSGGLNGGGEGALLGFVGTFAYGLGGPIVTDFTERAHPITTKGPT
jgi:RHS repeat-associated protein